MLGDRAGRPRRASLRARLLGLLAHRFGWLFVLALLEHAERCPADPDVPAAMAADEVIHAEVVRGLAARGVGAAIPVLPFLFGLTGLTAVVVAAVLTGLALMTTGATVGVLSGGPPLRRALRQLAIGTTAAAATYVLGLAFGTVVG